MSNQDTYDNGRGWPRSDGRTVPEGYFEDFATRMMAQLPNDVPARVEPRRTLWMKIRPYAYMAAMFAGVYLMMNIFTLTTGIRNAAESAEASNLLAELMTPGTTAYVEEYVAMSDPYFYDDLYETGFEIPENL